MLPSLLSEARLSALFNLAIRAPMLGAFVEIGVYQGGSAHRLYDVAWMCGQPLYLYDTFSGMPHADPAIDSHRIGEFSDIDIGRIRAAMPTAHIRPGVFPASLDRAMGPVAFAHLDCDQYASYRGGIAALLPRMVPGGIMVFDDYYALPSARRAVDEALPGQTVLVGETCHYIHEAA